MSSVISGANYLSIAQAYADAYEGQLALINNFFDAVDTIVLLNDIVPTVDLLGEFYTAYQLNQGRLQSTATFESPVRTIQQHVTRQSGQTITDWIQTNIIDAELAVGIPSAWAFISKIVGYDIDTLIDPATESSSSSSSS